MSHTYLKVRLLLGLAPAFGAVLWLGMDGGGTHYDKSPAQVKAALSAAYLPTHILGQYVKGSRVTMPDDKTVVTALIAEDGSELMRFVTTVIADGTGSEVDTEVRQPEGKYSKPAAEAMKSQAFTMSLMEKLADEHVAAAIEGRPFDMLAFNPMAKGIARAAGYDKQFNEASAAAMDMARAEQDDFAAGDRFANDEWVESSTEPEPDYGDSGGGWGE